MDTKKIKKDSQETHSFEVVRQLFKVTNKKWLVAIEKMYHQILDCDKNIACHCYITAMLAKKFLGYLIEQGFVAANQDQINTFTAAVLLQDIGKTDPAILAIVNNGRKITNDEKVKVQRHSNLGYQIVKEEGLDDVALIILYHHELWDGSGYPKGLKGEEIPLFCRILTICDSFTAIIDPSRSVYKGSTKTREGALEDMEIYKGIWYEAKLLNYFSDFIKKEHFSSKRFF